MDRTIAWSMKVLILKLYLLSQTPVTLSVIVKLYIKIVLTFTDTSDITSHC